jgi:dienelactone hydrolase
MRNRLITLALLAASVAPGAIAASATVFVPDPADAKNPLALEAFVYRPVGLGPFPILVLNHGSAGGAPKESISWKRDATYWSQRGYIVVAPMRRGRGRSTGVSPESEDKNCQVSDWFNSLPKSIQDLDATIEFAEKLPGAIPGAVTMIGVSRGGFLSVAYAAEGRHKSKLRSVVNFVGGWVAQAEDRCPNDFNSIAFERYAKATKTPMLWLYGMNDLFYGDAAVKSYIDTFRKSGGVADFHLIGGVPENGHWLPEYQAKWRRLVDDFLRSTNPI